MKTNIDNRNKEDIKDKRQHYAAFMLESINNNKIIWNFDQSCIKIGMCSSRGWSIRGTPAYQDTIPEGLVFTLFLGISSEGEYAVIVKKGFFNHYNTHYFFKLFLERVLAEDQKWAWKNTITLDNSRVQKNKFNYKKLLID